MRMLSCGDAEGKRVIYFHGAPGAPEECLLFAGQGKADGLNVLCPDRFAAAAALRGEAYFRALAAEILASAGTAKVHLVGFSLGAFVALQTSRYLPGQVASLDLISAAAPLEGGDFLPGMAGGAVFRLARRWPWAFRLLSGWQAVLARLAPSLLFGMLFATARAGDLALRADPQFRQDITEHLRKCFALRLGGYMRDLCSYVQPWADSLATVTAVSRIWHGTEDNWSPCGMAEYLAVALPACRQVTLMPGLSHYSCLLQAMPQVCAAIRDTP